MLRLFPLLLAFWLTLAPAAGALAQMGDTPCESMSMSMPADDCCSNDMDASACLTVCLAAAAALPAAIAPAIAAKPSAPVLTTPELRRASILAPPDIAPPKPSVS